MWIKTKQTKNNKQKIKQKPTTRKTPTFNFGQRNHFKRNATTLHCRCLQVPIGPCNTRSWPVPAHSLLHVWRLHLNVLIACPVCSSWGCLRKPNTAAEPTSPAHSLLTLGSDEGRRITERNQLRIVLDYVVCNVSLEDLSQCHCDPPPIKGGADSRRSRAGLDRAPEATRSLLKEENSSGWHPKASTFTSHLKESEPSLINSITACELDSEVLYGPHGSIYTEYLR